MQNGLDVKPSNGYQSTTIPSYDYNPPTATGQTTTWSASTSPYPSQPGGDLRTPQPETNLFNALPSTRTGCTGDNYLGVSSGNSNLLVKGTSLSILGMEIDIADFDSPDMDEPDPSVFHPQLYNKSYQAFLQTVLNVNARIEKAELPNRADGLTYAEWYFRVINAYFPILHKPTFFRTLIRLYDDPTFHPSPAETVMVHTLFAIMFFQYSVRNWEDTAQRTNLNHQSNMHYHYALGLVYQLTRGHTFQDVQALTLLCSHLRNFPKPGASWLLTQTTISLAVELGLHRSCKRWSAEFIPDPLEVEMRKRTFWGLLTIQVTLSGKLGRPMPLRLDDFDVEMPDPIDDELLSEKGLDTSKPGKCLHHVGLAGFRIAPLYIEMNTTVYSVRRNPEAYVSDVHRIEARIRAYEDALPPELRGEVDGNENERQVYPLYVRLWVLELRLLLRHPSMSVTADANFNKESTRICIETSRQMLGIVHKLQKYKSLDTTWYNAAVYVMALTTTLFTQWNKRGETSIADLAALRDDMDIWLDIMEEVGNLLGSGSRLKDAVRVVVDCTLGLLTRSLPQSKPAYSNAVEDTKPPRQPSVSHSTQISFPVPSQNLTYNSGTVANGDSTSSTYVPAENQIAHQQTPYPAATQYSAYPESVTNSSNLAYTSHDNFPNYPTNTDSVEAPLLTAFAAQASQVSPAWRATPGTAQINSGSQAWNQWTTTMSGNTGQLEPQDCYSANALMQLGGREIGNGATDNPQVTAGMVDMSVGAGSENGHLGGSVNGGIGVEWPLNIFGMGQGS